MALALWGGAAKGWRHRFLPEWKKANLCLLHTPQHHQLGVCCPCCLCLVAGRCCLLWCIPAAVSSLVAHLLPCAPQAYSAAVQSQWQWIKQLCLCVEQHVKENTAYFQVLWRGQPLGRGGKEGVWVLTGAAFS